MTLVFLIAAALAQATIGPPAPEPSAEHVAPALAIAFAPPVGETLRYRTLKSWRLGDWSYRVSFIRDYRFERREDGFRLWTELVAVEADPASGQAAILETTARPLVGLRYAIDLDEEGQPLGVVNGDEVWLRVLQGVAHIETELAQGRIAASGYDDVAQALLASIGNFGPDEQQRMLVEASEDLWALAGRRLPPGAAPYFATIEAPWGETIAMTGTAETVSMPHSISTVSLALSGEGSALRLEETSEYHVSATTGLVETLRRERRSMIRTDESEGQIEQLVMERIPTQ